MPHQFVNRPRLHALVGKEPSLRSQFRWETANAIIYVLGGILFIWGSFLFFPALEQRADRGAWIFFVGSMLYLVVTAHDMLEVTKFRRQLDHEPTIWDRVEVWSAASYLAGTLLFAGGSIFFLSSVGRYDLGALCFVIGSLLFVIGATINVLQIVQASDIHILQLMNLTALTFVTGSVLFTVASVPYLFNFDDTQDERIVDGFLAAQFVIGSVLFLAGGIFNYWRAYCVVEQAIADGGASEQTG
jgi:predicted membrane channel-forming protein YqfA (hemolysin III family)